MIPGEFASITISAPVKSGIARNQTRLQGQRAKLPVSDAFRFRTGSIRLSLLEDGQRANGLMHLERVAGEDGS